MCLDILKNWHLRVSRILGIQAVVVLFGRCAKTYLGDRGGNCSWSASSRTLDSWCVNGAWTGKLRAVDEQRINFF